MKVGGEGWGSTYGWRLIHLRVEHIGHRLYTFHTIRWRRVYAEQGRRARGG